MMNKIKPLFKGKEIEKKPKAPLEYAGFSDFFIHAPLDEKKKVITEAARRANEDQLKVFRERRLKAN